MPRQRSLSAQAKENVLKIKENCSRKINHFREFLRASARDNLCNQDGLSIDNHAVETIFNSFMRWTLCSTDYSTDLLENDIKRNFPSTTEQHRQGIIDFLQDDDEAQLMIDQLRHYLDSLDDDKIRLDFINAHFHPRDWSIHFHGDVPLPPKLCEIIVEDLPASLFSDPNTKFLFLQAKDGYSVHLIALRCMEGLSLEFPNRAERERLIWKHMIHVQELSEPRLEALKKAFPLLENTLLQKEPKDIKEITPAMFGLNSGQKFDAALGSPSFEGQSNRTSVWTKYWTAIASKCVKEGGYLGMVTPLGWLKPTRKQSRTLNLYPCMTRKYTMKRLAMFSKADTHKLYDGLVSLQGVSLMVVQTSSCPQDHTTMVKPIDYEDYVPMRLQDRRFLTAGGFNKLRFLSKKATNWEVCYSQVKNFTCRKKTRTVFTAKQIEEDGLVGYTVPVANGIDANGAVKQLGHSNGGSSGKSNLNNEMYPLY
jgi:hypothetical protein